MRVLSILLLCALCTGCKSLERLFTNSPLRGVETSGSRINLWPLYYESGQSIAVLWPVYDEDEKGFAIRPLVTKDGTDWEVLPPLCWWNTETGHWTFLPAYSLSDNFGLFPVFGIGDPSYVGPVWWNSTGEGDARALDSYGLFPLVSIGDKSRQVGPVFWGYRSAAPSAETAKGPDDDDPEAGPAAGIDELAYAAVIPVAGYWTEADGGGRFLSLLGGMGWDAEGENTFVNVLGPVFHRQSIGSGTTTAVVWPLFTMTDKDRYSGWSLWPLFHRGTYRDEKGGVSMVETSAITGLIRHAGAERTDALRVLPLFTYQTEDGGFEGPLDLLSLYGYKEYTDGSVGVHVGTPLLFNYRGAENGFRWSTLLGTIQYETEDDESEFSFLYYLYRQKTFGTETRRDFFPFFSWDSGEERSAFSFLWRVFNWERNGDRVGGHILFIPWGEF